MKKQFSLLMVLFISIAFGGCTTTHPSVFSPQLHATSTLETPAQSDVSKEKEFITATVEKIIPTFAPTSANTPETIDTIESAIAMMTVQPLITQPLNCGSIPCFWGIIPGKTTLSEVKTFFGSLGYESLEGVDPSTNKNFYSITYDSNNRKTSGLVVNFDTSNIVEYMEITPSILKPKDGEPPDLSGLSPEMLIKMYGSPSRVNIVMGLGQMSNIHIGMIMYFENAKVIANYSGYNMTPENFCPLSAPFDYARLWIGKNPQNTPPYETLPLEKVSTLNTEEFSKLLLGDPQKACFSLNVDMFK
jgi:hypothetical protein